MKKVALVYLAREAVAVHPFMAAMGQFKAGCNFDLIWLRKGDHGPAVPYPLKVTRIIEINDEGHSLAAFAKALPIIADDYDFICYLNSWSLPACDYWLWRLVDAASKSNAGLCGATGSCESFSTNHKGWLGRNLRRLLFPPFPNVHLRTTGFCARTEVLRKIWPKHFYGFKSLEHLHEAGRWSISRRAEKLGLMNQLVGRKESRWHVSWCWTRRLFRCKDDEGLLIKDNQTQKYEKATEAEKLELERKAWGK